MAHDALKIESTPVKRRATRLRHTPHASTVTALSARRNGLSLRGLARALHYTENFAPTLGDVLNGRAGVITISTENDLRARLGLAPIPAPLTVPPCPDCGNVHTGRCHGKPVAQVVCLAPDETVRPGAQPRNPRRTPYGALSLRRTTLDRLAQHRTGRTADALINALLDKWEQEPTP